MFVSRLEPAGESEASESLQKSLKKRKKKHKKEKKRTRRDQSISDLESNIDDTDERHDGRKRGELMYVSILYYQTLS